ncbi:MAG: hypothetical protein MR704_19320 [Clostridia bacterium]|nr:hypothetical protein [Clostridia bacterium]
MEQELKNMLTLIYEEVKEFKVRVINLETQTTSLREDLETRTTSLRNDLQAQINSLREELDKRTSALDQQAKRHFEILERDLGGALDWGKYLQEKKVDKEALKQAAV